jgi:cinnamoyl-CoA:phenyllactate CoA-transferase
MENDRPLAGVKVVELAIFITAASCGRFLADQGAEVIKIEDLRGDGTRFPGAGLTEGRPTDLPGENLTFEIENGNKRGLSMNLKNPDCYHVLMELLAQADIFITNWRPQALKRLGLDYETLKEKFPKLVYGAATGYGEKGPDKDLPGYDFTAFWTRSGLLGSLYDKDGAPMNLIPSMGDRVVGMCMAAGVMAALYRAAKTGKGDKVSVSLLGAAIFLQATMMQTAQYGLITYPISRRENPNPLIGSYQTKDGRWVEISMPNYDLQWTPFAKAMNPGWLNDERFSNVENLKKGPYMGDLCDAIAARFAELTSAEVAAIMTEADQPYAIAQVWREVLQDPQAWANDYFTELEYESGTRTLVRPPVQFQEAGLPPVNKAPRLGQDTAAILKELGYSEEYIKKMRDVQTIIAE